MQNIISRIELFFLDYFILVLTESTLIRSMIANTIKFMRQYKEGIGLGGALLVCGMVGLVAGRLLFRTGIVMFFH
jgi:hypothetical protein